MMVKWTLRLLFYGAMLILLLAVYSCVSAGSAFIVVLFLGVPYLVFSFFVLGVVYFIQEIKRKQED